MEANLAIERTQSAESTTKPHSAGDGRVEETKPDNEKESHSDNTRTSTPVGEKAIAVPDKDDGHDYISGLNLIVVMGSLVLTCFLMLLDTSILSTVSSNPTDMES